MSPTARSLKIMRERGYKAFTTSYWNSFAKKRIDFAGFADIVCFGKKERGCTAVQATSTSNILSRYNKIVGSINAEEWLLGENKILVHGWGKKGKKGKRKVYTLKEMVVTAADF